MTPLTERFYGVGLLPGIIGLLLIAALLRRRAAAGSAASPVGRALSGLATWQAPYLVAAYTGTYAVVILSLSDWSVAALAWWGVAFVYIMSTYIFRKPGWLYPASGTSLVAYVATVHALWPDLSWAVVMATLIAPAGALFWSAHVLSRRDTPAEQLSWPYLGAAGVLASRWAPPLLISGTVALVVGLAGSAPEAGPGLATAIAFSILAGALATLWSGRVEAWLSLGLAALALQHSLRIIDPPALDQPPIWAAAAVVVGLATILTGSRPDARLRMWSGVLSPGSIVIGMLAIGYAMSLQAAEMTRAALDPFSWTVALAGIGLITHAYVQWTRLSTYAGVALLLWAYMLRLPLLEVTELQAFSFPAGLYLLAIAYNEWRRGSRESIRWLLEVSGILLLLGATTIQSLGMLGVGEDRYSYVAVLLVQSLGVFGFGAIVHWRKAFFAGIAGIVVGISVLLEEPMRSMNTWYLVLIVGILMLIVVGFIEQRRREIPLWIGEWRHRLESWS
jgi:hypothetical protein